MMRISNTFKVSRKYFAAGLLCLAMMLGFNAAAYAEWHYGIGTGMLRMNIDGDQGFNTVIAGPVQFPVDLDPDQVSDLVDTAFGFNGYATDGTWMVQYSFSNIELEGSSTVGAVSTTIGFDVQGAEITLGYPVYHSPGATLGVLGGVRYTSHELTGTVTAGSTISRSIENDWTDALVGLTLTVPLAQKWAWNNRIDAGFGGSEGTYAANTGVTWRFYKGWSGTLFAKFTAVEFENGSKGDTDWYLYDVDEFGPGLAFLYNW